MAYAIKNWITHKGKSPEDFECRYANKTLTQLRQALAGQDRSAVAAETAATLNLAVQKQELE